MSQWKIYHNPKCSKSREALTLLQQNGIEAEVIEYLHQPLSEKELYELLQKLDSPPASLVRIKEEAYQNNPFELQSPKTIAQHLAQNPRLMERPVVMKDNIAVIGRPIEKIQKLL